MKLTEIEQAYIAGFFDGEGCLHISKKMRKNQGKNYCYSLKSVISNTKLEPLKYIKIFFGGSISKQNRKINQKDIYFLQMNIKSTINLLKNIYPYLRIKKEQANVAFKIIEVKKNYSPLRKGHRQSNGHDGFIVDSLYSDKEYIELLENCKQEMMKLNKKGKN